MASPVCATWSIRRAARVGDRRAHRQSYRLENKAIIKLRAGQGRYRVAAVATDAAGNRSATVRGGFAIRQELPGKGTKAGCAR